MCRRVCTYFAAIVLLLIAVPSTPALAQDAVAHLSTALQEQIQANTIVGNPALGEDVAAIRNAVQQAQPHAQTVQSELQAALGLVSGPTQQLTQRALDELNSAMQLGQLVLTGPDDMVVLRHGELKAHGGAALAMINLALLSLGAGPSAPGAGHILDVSELQLPEGYQAEIVANGLNFATVVTVAQDGTIYLAEAGFSYGLVETPARVLRVGPGGTMEVVAEGFQGPVAGLAILDGTLFVSHRGTISAVDLATGAVSDIVTGLPSVGSHYNENIAVGPDGKLYFGQGTVTNSGVVGLDSYLMGWLPMAPQSHDIPCRDLTLAGQNYTTGNPLTPDVTDTVTTGAYLPFGTPSAAGQVVAGQVKCSGAVLRVNSDGSGLEVFADGFRNPYGLAFHPDGRLFITENGPDDRGSRPVSGPDNFYEVVQGGWYGWPDFYAGVPVNDPSRKPETAPVSQPVLLNPPPLARLPLAQFENHTAAVGFDFSRSDAFAPVGQAFVAQLGDISPPTTGGVELIAGHQLVVVTSEGQVWPFLTSSATSPDGHPIFRPTDATFDPSGQVLYVTHFGQIEGVPGGIVPTPGTGALIKITRVVEEQPGRLPDTGAGGMAGGGLAGSLAAIGTLLAAGGYELLRRSRRRS